jgi:hypothetical protein
MRQRTLMWLVGALSFVAVIIATLPASLVTSRLPPGVGLDGAGGTIWSGAADQLRVRGVPLGALSWSLEPLALLAGRLSYHLELTRADGYVRGSAAVGVGGAVSVTDLALRVDVNALSGAGGAPGGWQGVVDGTIARARLEQGWPVALEGTVTVSDVRPPGVSVPLGSYAIDFDPAAAGPAQLVARVHDVKAPLMVRAQLNVARARSYVLAGDVTPRADTPPEVLQAIAFLGVPDAAGRRQFSVTGVF